MAVLSDVGLCASCNVKNSIHATRCHSCGSTLPWAEAKAAPAKTAPSKVAAAKAKVQKLDMSDRLPAVSGEALAYWGVGVVVFGVAASCPLVGYAMYRYFDNDGNDLAGFARTGALTPLVLLALMLVASMARVGAMH